MKSHNPHRGLGKKASRCDDGDFVVSVIEKLKAGRKEKGLTQGELAKLVGTKQSAISRFESGRYNPSIEFLTELASVLGKTVQISLNSESDFAIEKLVRKERKAKGIKQGELAKLVGTKQSAISRFESGRYNPSVEFLQNLTGALNSSLHISIN